MHKKIEKWRLAPIALMVILIAGCTGKQATNSDLPSDTKESGANTTSFELFYHITPGTKPGMGSKGTTITINNLDMQYKRDYPAGWEADTNITLTDEQKILLIRTVQESGFFSLPGEDFVEARCWDGKTETVKIKIGSKEKNASIYCRDVKAVEQIKSALFQISGATIQNAFYEVAG